MTTKSTTNTALYTAEELRQLFEALHAAPGYISKRFILQHLCGWSEDMIKNNQQMKQQELDASKTGDRVKGYTS
jgi:hypothetical protein